MCDSIRLLYLLTSFILQAGVLYDGYDYNEILLYLHRKKVRYRQYSWPLLLRTSSTAGQPVAPCSVTAVRIGVEHRCLGVGAVRAADWNEACRSDVDAFELNLYVQPLPAGRLAHRRQALLLRSTAPAC